MRKAFAGFFGAFGSFSFSGFLFLLLLGDKSSSLVLLSLLVTERTGACISCAQLSLSILNSGSSCRVEKQKLDCAYVK